MIQTLDGHTALVYIRGTEEDAAELVAPLQEVAQADVLPARICWSRNGTSTRSSTASTDDDDVDPAGFGAWGFEALLHDRLPRYQKLADRYGYIVEARDVATVRDGHDFMELMRKAIAARAA